MGLSRPADPGIDPSLLDVVPWPYGYAHSWAVASLLSDQRTAGAILEALPGLEGRRPLRIDGPVRRERGLKPARADLAFTVQDAGGEHQQLALETKVNDAFRAEQMAAYRQAKHVPVLFLPGLTGLLLEPTQPTEAGEARLYGHTLLAAVDGLDLHFGALLAGYLDGLREETRRMERARAWACGDFAERVGPGQCAQEDLEGVAWLAETFRALPEACRDKGVPAEASMRIEANDRGFFFNGSFTWVADEGGLWVDVMADVRTHARAVAIKAGEKGLAEAWDLAAADVSGPGDGWRRAARRVGGGTATVWKRSLDGVPAREAAAEAVYAACFIRQFG